MTQTTTASLPQPDAAGDAASSVLLGEQTLASLLHNVAFVYQRHFGVIFWCCVLPMTPFVLLEGVMQAMHHEAVVLASLGTTLTMYLVFAALTVVVSDICLGRAPSVAGAYARVLRDRRWTGVLTTTLLVWFFLWLGMLLLLLPGLWFAMRALFTGIVVVLEERRNMAAVRRSFALTRGQFWRVTGLMLLPVLLALVVGMVLAMLLGAALGVAGLTQGWPMHIGQAVGGLLMVGTLLPTVGLTAVLLYYDQRARRESYDQQSLAEDLMR